MLYDNPQLARVYLHAWQVTGNVFFHTITEEILDYAEFLLRELRQVNDRLLRTWKASPEKGEGAGEAMIAHYQSPEGAFYDTSDDHETLITRPRDLQDNATPSGNAMAITALLKLAGFTNELRYVDIARRALAQMQTPTGGGMMSQYPLGKAQWILALAYALSKPREIAIVGDPDCADTQALLNVVREGYQPFHVVALGAPDRDTTVPLLGNRGLVDAQAAAYVCDAPVSGRAFACQAPVTDPGVLQSLLETG